MKRLIIPITLIALSINTYAQKIESDKVIGNKRTIVSSYNSAKEIADRDLISFGLKATTNANDTQFDLCLKITTPSSIAITANNKLVLVCNDNSIVELLASDNCSATTHKINTIGKVAKTEYTVQPTYAISKEQIAQLSSGVSKISIETNDLIIHKTYKKNKVGNLITADYSMINNALANK